MISKIALTFNGTGKWLATASIWLWPQIKFLISSWATFLFYCKRAVNFEPENLCLCPGSVWPLSFSFLGVIKSEVPIPQWFWKNEIKMYMHETIRKQQYFYYTSSPAQVSESSGLKSCSRQIESSTDWFKIFFQWILFSEKSTFHLNSNSEKKEKKWQNGKSYAKWDKGKKFYTHSV